MNALHTEFVFHPISRQYGEYLRRKARCGHTRNNITGVEIPGFMRLELLLPPLDDCFLCQELITAASIDCSYTV